MQRSVCPVVIAVAIRLRTGCRGEAPAWGQRPHPPFVLTELATAISLDVTDLFEQPEPAQYSTNRKKKSSTQVDGSMVGEVDKEALLNWVDQIAAEQPLDEAEMAEQIWDLAYGENVGE